MSSIESAGGCWKLTPVHQHGPSELMQSPRNVNCRIGVAEFDRQPFVLVWVQFDLGPLPWFRWSGSLIEGCCWGKCLVTQPDYLEGSAVLCKKRIWSINYPLLVREEQSYSTTSPQSSVMGLILYQTSSGNLMMTILRNSWMFLHPILPQHASDCNCFRTV